MWTKGTQKYSLDIEIEQKLDTVWAAVDERMTHFSKDIEAVKESTKAKMQAVEGVVKDMHVDMNKNLLQINEDMNKVKACLLYTSPSPRD